MVDRPTVLVLHKRGHLLHTNPDRVMYASIHGLLGGIYIDQTTCIRVLCMGNMTDGDHSIYGGVMLSPRRSIRRALFVSDQSLARRLPGGNKR